MCTGQKVNNSFKRPSLSPTCNFRCFNLTQREKLEKAEQTMAETRRVFVQQAALAMGASQQQVLQMSPPVMAFVVPEDSWLMIVNELVMVRTGVLKMCRLRYGLLSVCCCMEMTVGCGCVPRCGACVCDSGALTVYPCVRVRGPFLSYLSTAY